jgi:hypothetical protein
MGSGSHEVIGKMNAVAGDRHLGALCCPEAEPLVLVRRNYFNRGAVLAGFVGDAASFGPDLFPRSFLEDDMEKCMYLHSAPFWQPGSFPVPAQSATEMNHGLWVWWGQGLKAVL